MTPGELRVMVASGLALWVFVIAALGGLHDKTAFRIMLALTVMALLLLRPWVQCRARRRRWRDSCRCQR